MILNPGVVIPHPIYLVTILRSVHVPWEGYWKFYRHNLTSRSAVKCRRHHQEKRVRLPKVPGPERRKEIGKESTLKPRRILYVLGLRSNRERPVRNASNWVTIKLFITREKFRAFLDIFCLLRQVDFLIHPAL